MDSGGRAQAQERTLPGPTTANNQLVPGERILGKSLVLSSNVKYCKLAEVGDACQLHPCLPN